MLRKLESYFEFSHLGTNWRTEILAGITTFLTMAYIVLVNPAILADAGVPLAAVTAATCLSAAFGSILMGVVARYPIALAPGMGLNAYFTYTVCIKMHVPWQTALGAVFLSGVIFLALTATGVRQMILRAIPHQLYAAVASGIGLFIAFIGFVDSGSFSGELGCSSVGLGGLPWTSTAKNAKKVQLANVSFTSPIGNCGPGNLTTKLTNGVIKFTNVALAGGCTVSGSIKTKPTISIVP